MNTPKAAPMRDDVTQAPPQMQPIRDEADAPERNGLPCWLWHRIWSGPMIGYWDAKSAWWRVVTGALNADGDIDMSAWFGVGASPSHWCSLKNIPPEHDVNGWGHRLANTARPDAGDAEVERVADLVKRLHEDADRWMSCDGGRDNEEAGLLSYHAAVLLGRLPNLIIAARRMVEASDWASNEPEWRERIATLDQAVERFATAVPWEDDPAALAAMREGERGVVEREAFRSWMRSALAAARSNPDAADPKAAGILEMVLAQCEGSAK